MARHQQYLSPARTAASLEEARDLRAAITRALVAAPRDEHELRQLVWRYVENERQALAPPGGVVLALTQLIERASIEAGERGPLRRQVILWCVEAYLGHLGGDVFRESSRDATVASAMSEPRS